MKFNERQSSPALYCMWTFYYMLPWRRQTLPIHTQVWALIYPPETWAQLTTADILTFTLLMWSLDINCMEEAGLTSLPLSSGPSSSPPYLLSSALPLLHILAALTPLSFLPQEGRSGPVAVENGCHDNGAQLYPFAVGESVSRPPTAGPRHADEGQHLCPWQLGVSAGNRHLPRNHMLHCISPVLGAWLHNNDTPVATFVLGYCTIINWADAGQFARHQIINCSVNPWI